MGRGIDAIGLLALADALAALQPVPAERGA